MTWNPIAGLRIVIAAAVVVLTATLVACSGDSSNGTSTTTSSPTPSVLAPTTPVLSQTQKNVAAAEDTVRAFYAATDRLYQNNQLPIDELNRLTREKSYTEWSDDLRGERIRGYKQIGDTQIVTISGRSKASNARPTVLVSVCYDVSNVKVVDRTGKSVVSPKRINKARATYDVQQWADGWYIAEDTARGEPC